MGVLDLLPAWKAHGEASFSYEILEHVDEDNPHKLELLVKELTANWPEMLGVRPFRTGRR
ncbi:MAG: hypothetical protein ABL956_06185 [Hyphomonadaceae bacterium]